MTKSKPALVTQTKRDNDTITDVKVNSKRTVTYVFNIISAKNLSIPYAVSVGGVEQEEFKSKPKRVNGDKGKIVVRNVDPGKQVVLFINSDAHPSYRKNPVYSVTPGDRDAMVTIEERRGRHSETDIPSKIQVKDDLPGESVDFYSAVLTGDIWMKVSHRYSAEEVDALLPKDISSTVVAAVKKIYEGLPRPSLEINTSFESPVARERTLSITFDDGDNPRANISSQYDFLKDGLTRVHPAGFAAVFNAAISSGIGRLAMTSAWRPMLGSIAHRAGLGLDVNYIDATRLNRQKLRKDNAVDANNVSADEKSLFSTLEKLIKQQSSAKKEVGNIEMEVKRCKDNPAKLIVAKQKQKEAIEASVALDKARKEAEIAWDAERNKNEPANVRRFRNELIKSKSIVQIFDPWFMDANTRDDVDATPNMQNDDNDNLHAHHLHVTVYEPKIL